MSDPDLRKLKDFARRVTRGQADSALFCQIWSDKMRNDPSSDPVPIFQLGYAMILDKPIVIVAPQGSAVPENIKRAAIAVEYFDPQDEASLRAATMRVLEAAGIDAKH